VEGLAASPRGPNNNSQTELLLMADNDGQQAAEIKSLLEQLRRLLGLSDDAAALDVLKAAVERLNALLSEDEGSEDKAVAQSVKAFLDLPCGLANSYCSSYSRPLRSWSVPPSFRPRRHRR
jgi:hypothetical protein